MNTAFAVFFLGFCLTLLYLLFEVNIIEMEWGGSVEQLEKQIEQGKKPY
jgi:predicted metal-binding membrane protein